MNDLNEMLKSFNNFEECILLEIEWKNYGLNIDFIFDYVYDNNGILRKDLNNEKRIVVRFNTVQELHIIHDFNESILKNPENLDWGINEISLIRIVDNHEKLSRYNTSSKNYHQAIIYWESNRKIEIIFEGVEIIPRFLNVV